MTDGDYKHDLKIYVLKWNHCYLHFNTQLFINVLAMFSLLRAVGKRHAVQFSPPFHLSFYTGSSVVTLVWKFTSTSFKSWYIKSSQNFPIVKWDLINECFFVLVICCHYMLQSMTSYKLLYYETMYTLDEKYKDIGAVMNSCMFPWIFFALYVHHVLTHICLWEHDTFTK